MAENSRLRAQARQAEEHLAKLTHEVESRSHTLNGLGTGAQELESRLETLLAASRADKAEVGRLVRELETASTALVSAQRSAQQAALDLQRAQRAEAQHRRDAREAQRLAALAGTDRADALAIKTASAAAAADAERARRQVGVRVRGWVVLWMVLDERKSASVGL